VALRAFILVSIQKIPQSDLHHALHPVGRCPSVGAAAAGRGRVGVGGSADRKALPRGGCSCAVARRRSGAAGSLSVHGLPKGHAGCTAGSGPGRGAGCRTGRGETLGRSNGGHPVRVRPSFAGARVPGCPDREGAAESGALRVTRCPVRTATASGLRCVLLLRGCRIRREPEADVQGCVSAGVA
jgi:hypothetical protein